MAEGRDDRPLASSQAKPLAEAAAGGLAAAQHSRVKTLERPDQPLDPLRPPDSQLSAVFAGSARSFLPGATTLVLPGAAHALTSPGPPFSCVCFCVCFELLPFGFAPMVSGTGGALRLRRGELRLPDPWIADQRGGASAPAIQLGVERSVDPIRAFCTRWAPCDGLWAEMHGSSPGSASLLAAGLARRGTRAPQASQSVKIHETFRNPPWLTPLHASASWPSPKPGMAAWPCSAS